MTAIFILYLIACVFVGYIGRNSRLGFWGVLVASVLVSPLVTFIILILFGRRGMSQGG